MAGILVGVLIGGALGLLFAPETGEETREMVAEKARKFKDAAAEKSRSLMHHGEEEQKED